MRKLAPFLAIAAILCFSQLIPAPVGPSEALAADFPALPDGGSVVTTTDGGSLIVVNTGRSNGWHMVIRCENQSTRYLVCESSTCTPNRHNAPLDSNVTYDLPVPPNYPYLGISTDDAGIPLCTVLYANPE